MEMESIKGLVSEMKEEILSSGVDLSSFVSPSAYDTAWVAMIPDPDRPDRPLFSQCLEWIMEQQREEGLWGERGTIECLSASVACMVALKMWGVGPWNVDRGTSRTHFPTPPRHGGQWSNLFRIIHLLHIHIMC